VFHRSQRLLLRPIWPEDWQGVLAGIADEGVVRNLSSVPWPYGEHHAREFAARPVEPLFPRFLITRARDAQVVGCIGIGPIEPWGQTELGYWIARPFWGQGFATEAGRAVLGIAKALGHRELVSAHFLDNPASGQVLRKLGFETTGRIEERFSCGRGEMVPAIGYRLVFGEETGGDTKDEHQRAA